jgi:hypothetical protein
LQEIAWRLLRDGHVPLIIGPYADSAYAPTSVRALVYEVVNRAFEVNDSMRLKPFVPKVLSLDKSPSEMIALGTGVATRQAIMAKRAIRESLLAFRDNPVDCDPGTVRELLADDLTGLAKRARKWKKPFGEHSRTVVLCHSVHTWASPTLAGPRAPLGALDGLLSMLAATGLGERGRQGRPDKIVPVVIVGSPTGAGAALLLWGSRGYPWARTLDLFDLSPDEALLGYQWVLLHPWSTKLQQSDKETYSSTYTASPGRSADWLDGLAEVGLNPTSVEGDLYFAARLMVKLGVGARNDDVGFWRAYADINGNLP